MFTKLSVAIIVFAVFTFVRTSWADRIDESPSVFSSANTYACKVKHKRRDWYRAMQDTQQTWGLPISHQLAFMEQDWGLTSKTLPSKWRPDWSRGDRPRPRMAGGMFDATWQTYSQSSGKTSTSKNKFEDIVDFMGWYFANLAPPLNIGPDNARSQFRLWRQGPDGFNRHQNASNAWIKVQEEQFKARVEEINKDLQNCEIKLAPVERDDEYWSIPLPFKKHNTQENRPTRTGSSPAKKHLTPGRAAITD